MSLQVWLPLNGNSDNQGLSDVVVVNNGATVDNNGKIGKCYKCSGDSRISFPSFNWMTMKPQNNFSFFFWAKGTTTGWLFACSAWEFRLCPGYIQIHLAGNGQYPARYTSTFDSNTWYHLGFTWSGNNGKLLLYLNGFKVAESDVPSSANFDIASTFNLPYDGPRYLNDIRIYDHCLSPREVKEISKGLVLHYLLNDSSNGKNLITNGFGNLGDTNWSTPSAISTEIPPNGIGIEKSFINNQTLEYIPINNDCIYTFSVYVKSSGGTSGYTYPSFMPYDIDKKFIQHHNVADGFNINTKTTLAKALNPGDTVIYATDLSKWSTSTSNYFFHVAIFGYKDSTGYVYPDLGYTADSPSFGSYSDKSNLNLANNTITLKSAYTGEPRVAGTTICQATEGASYWYPFGSITLDSISDWTYKTMKFNITSQSRLKYAKYLQYYTWSGAYNAGIELIQGEKENNSIEYDCSGYRNHGTKNGDIVMSINSPRYDKCYYFNSTSQYISTPTIDTSGFTNSYTFSWWGKVPSYSSVMFWGFSNGNRLNYYSGLYCNTGDGSSNPFYSSGTTTISTPSTNTWHHFAMVGNGSSTQLYVDGVLYGTAKAYRSLTGTKIYINGWDSGTSYKTNGYISDFRLYSTALSATDIKELYNAPISITNNGALMTQGEVIE